MIIYYDNNGAPLNFCLDKETPILNQNNLVIDEIFENRAIIQQIMVDFSTPDIARYQITNNQLIKDGVVIVLVVDVDRQQLKNAYQAMITRLEQIQNAGAIPFTVAGFAQVVQAIKDEALYIERIMKILAKLI